MGSHAPAKRITRRFDHVRGLQVVVAQLVARNLAKVEVAGSNPVYDSIPLRCNGRIPLFQSGRASSILASGSMPVGPVWTGITFVS